MIITPHAHARHAGRAAVVCGGGRIRRAGYRQERRRRAVGVGAGAAGARMKTAPLLRLRSDGTPEMLIAGTLADGARYEDSAEAARAWAA